MCIHGSKSYIYTFLIVFLYINPYRISPGSWRVTETAYVQRGGFSPSRIMTVIKVGEEENRSSPSQHRNMTLFNTEESSFDEHVHARVDRKREINDEQRNATAAPD